MRIIITGATGLVGRNLVECLNEKDVDVIATGRSPEVGAELREHGIAFRQADIRDKEQSINSFSPADFVIHCAAITGPWGRYRDFYDTNVVGTRNIIAACKHHRIKRIIFISTPNIYYTGKDRYNISESDPLPDRIITNYAKTKLISEKELMALQPEGFKYIILRPRAVFGRYDNTFVPRILRLAEKRRMPLINSGQALVDLTCVDNFIDAVNACLAAPESSWNQIYNISNNEPITIKDWVSTVLEIFGKPFKPKNVPVPLALFMAAIMESVSYFPFVNKEPSMTRFTVGYMARSMTMNISKAKEMLGYFPKISNRKGFKRYAQWVRLQSQSERPSN
jgi:nucleoside-diphosphate-sugar epimerase